MAADRTLDLREMSELRDAIAARPPRLAHASVVLAAVLLGAIVTWAALTRADVVVRGAARVRPADAPLRAFDDLVSEQLSAEVGGRIAEVRVREGQAVAAGDVLVVLDTAAVDHELERLDAELAAAREELASLDALRDALAAQLDAAQATGEAELRRAARSVGHSRRRAVTDRHLAEVELADAERELDRARQLAATGAGAEADVTTAEARVARARERQTAAGIGVDDGEPEVLRRSLAQAKRDHDVKLVDLRRQRAVKAGEIAAAEARRAGLELDRSHATVVAPCGGVVALGGLGAGDVIAPGKLPIAIVEQGRLRVDAAIDTGHVADVHVGMRARVALHALDERRYGTATGTITHVGADAIAPSRGGAPYYLISVALDGDALGTGAERRALRPGMTGELEVITERDSLLHLFFDSLRGSLSL